MKRRLNILCVIVLLVLGYSVLETTYYVGLGIKAGIEKGFDSKIDAKAKEEISNVQVVQLVPKDLGGDTLIDSVYNEKTGEYVPAAYGQMIVSVNTQPSVLSRIVSLLILILNYVAIVWAVVLIQLEECPASQTFRSTAYYWFCMYLPSCVSEFS